MKPLRAPAALFFPASAPPLLRCLLPGVPSPHFLLSSSYLSLKNFKNKGKSLPPRSRHERPELVLLLGFSEDTHVILLRISDRCVFLISSVRSCFRHSCCGLLLSVSRVPVLRADFVTWNCLELAFASPPAPSPAPGSCWAFGERMAQGDSGLFFAFSVGALFYSPIVTVITTNLVA